jgi:protein SCO1/2
MRLVALLLGLSLFMAGCSEPELTGFVREPAPSVGNERLPDVSRDGEAFEFRADEGQLLLVYFGYTSCPDVCPTTLADTRTALSELGDDADNVDFAMATIDPMRDTNEVITGYVKGFLPAGHALRTEDEALLTEVVTAFGASYSVSPDLDGEYVVTHTGSLYAVDDQGELLVTWPFGTTTEDLASDLEILVGRL